MNGNQTLHLVCQPTRKLRGVLMPCLVIVVISAAFAAHGSAVSWPFIIVSLLLVVASAALLYRNLFYREELWILRAGVEQGNARFGVRTTEIVSVRRLAPPVDYSAEGKLAAIGLGKGLIEIETKTDTFRFGASLDDYTAEATLNEIDAFLRSDRAADKAA